MPNQRHPDRRSVTCWIKSDTFDLLTELARGKKRSRTAVAEEILEREVERRRKLRHAAETKNTD